MILQPEQDRYTASLTIAYSDLTRQQDIYAFIPSLRRSQPVIATALRSDLGHGYQPG